MSHVPYTYLIGWSKLNKWYYGSRTAKNCHPSELWIKYFTSSKFVKEFRRLYGESVSHCNPQTSSGSPSVFGYSKNAHRNGDLRDCGATTVVEGQSTVFCDGQLWAVLNDPNDHGEGRLINSGTTVFINGKPVIVHAPDMATPDNLCAPAPPEGGGS